MTNYQSHFGVTTYFILTDSHGKYVPPLISTPAYSIEVMAISGLKWIDQYNPNLSAMTLLSSPTLQQRLSNAKAIMFIIGTNSVRCTPAAVVATQITHAISLLRSHHSHLSDKQCINIVPCFPCLKPIYPLHTSQSLSLNIAHYNSMLVDLATELNFTLVDFYVTEHHLGPDRMHFSRQHRNLVQTSIQNYVAYLSSLHATPISSITGRSTEARARRNQRRHQKQALNQRQHFFTRPIHSSWSVIAVKEYLHAHNIKFAKLPPIYRNLLRIQFNNPVDQHIADELLSPTAFVQPHSPQASA